MPESQQPNLFSKSGLTLCGLDTAAVGTHNITFQVSLIACRCFADIVGSGGDVRLSGGGVA